MPAPPSSVVDFLACPCCNQRFDGVRHFPISLDCGHSICKPCLQRLSSEKNSCPSDSSDPVKPEVLHLPVNTALLAACDQKLNNPQELTDSIVHTFPSPEETTFAQSCYSALENYGRRLAAANANQMIAKSHMTLSRPMQKKLIMLINCQVATPAGRVRMARNVRAVGERCITEMILYHQQSHQLSTNLWGSVRSRGCQFLGPDMQEKVIRLILVALDKGTALARKTLVYYVVQQLSGTYPQASKTAIGHVVQLLYRASCFKVTKRDNESSLMELKDEYLAYNVLRKEHDAQIIQIANEAGLRIAPEQWSSLLYGCTDHKPDMQSIIDGLHRKQKFSQSITELLVAVRRANDPANLSSLHTALNNMAVLVEDEEPNIELMSVALEATDEVLSALTDLNKNFTYSRRSDPNQASHPKFKTSLCRDLTTKGACPRGANCTFAHDKAELERHRIKQRTTHGEQKEWQGFQYTDDTTYMQGSDDMFEGLSLQDDNIRPPTESSTPPNKPAGPPRAIVWPTVMSDDGRRIPPSMPMSPGRHQEHQSYARRPHQPLYDTQSNSGFGRQTPPIGYYQSTQPMAIHSPQYRRVSPRQMYPHVQHTTSSHHMQQQQGFMPMNGQGDVYIQPQYPPTQAMPPGFYAPAPMIPSPEYHTQGGIYVQQQPAVLQQQQPAVLQQQHQPALLQQQHQPVILQQQCSTFQPQSGLAQSPAHILQQSAVVQQQQGDTMWQPATYTADSYHVTSPMTPTRLDQQDFGFNDQYSSGRSLASLKKRRDELLEKLQSSQNVIDSQSGKKTRVSHNRIENLAKSLAASMNVGDSQNELESSLYNNMMAATDHVGRSAADIFPRVDEEEEDEEVTAISEVIRTSFPSSTAGGRGQTSWSNFTDSTSYYNSLITSTSQLQTSPRSPLKSVWTSNGSGDLRHNSVDGSTSSSFDANNDHLRKNISRSLGYDDSSSLASESYHSAGSTLQQIEPFSGRTQTIDDSKEIIPLSDHHVISRFGPIKRSDSSALVSCSVLQLSSDGHEDAYDAVHIQRQIQQVASAKVQTETLQAQPVQVNASRGPQTMPVTAVTPVRRPVPSPSPHCSRYKDGIHLTSIPQLSGVPSMAQSEHFKQELKILNNEIHKVETQAACEELTQVEQSIRQLQADTTIANDENVVSTDST